MTADVVVADANTRFEIRTSGVEKMLDDAPRTVAFHMRDGLHDIFLEFRRRWLAANRARFRMSDRELAPITNRIPSRSPRNDARMWFVASPPRSAGAKQKLDNVSAQAFTYSDVHLRLEKGGVVVPRNGSKYLRLPIGAALDGRGRVKKEYARDAKIDRKEHTVRKNKRGTLVLYRVKRGGQRVFEPVAILVQRVVMRRLLSFMRTWDLDNNRRDRSLSRVLDRSVADISAGRVRG